MPPSDTNVALVEHRTESQKDTAPIQSDVRFYRPELDVLRFCAFLMVYLGHALIVYPESPDWLKALKFIPGFGVPLFFALSAYLVTELLLTEKLLTKSVNVRYFYSRRILRIWPLYFLVLGVGFLLSHLYPGTVVPSLALVSYMLLLGNWYTTRYGYLSFGLGPLWSISIEEQFYLLWPWVVRIATRRTLAVICLVGWASSQASLFYFCYRHTMNSPAVWTNSVVQLQYFAIGVGLCLYLNGSVPKLRNSVRIAMILGALLLYVAAECFFNANGIRGLDDQSSIAHTYPVYFFGGVSVLTILIGFLGCASFRSWRGLRYLGKISYGLYVYHPMAIGLAAHIGQLLRQGALFTLIFGLIADMGIAWLSYEYLEIPFMRLKERFAIVKSRGV
jgi:peptidoglycan/LPS O-acetylase OafA/YrhL